MKIVLAKDAPYADVHYALMRYRGNSRFTFDIHELRSGRVQKLSKIRLIEKKEYCGNHPFGCERPGGPKHKILPFLEGADWVEFNDAINDILDGLSVAARVETTVCVIRKWNLRRTRYWGHRIGMFANAWDRSAPESDWVDNMGGSPMESEFPMGTPGIYKTKEMYCEIG